MFSTICFLLTFLQFLKCISTVTGKDVHTFMEQWVYLFWDVRYSSLLILLLTALVALKFEVFRQHALYQVVCMFYFDL